MPVVLESNQEEHQVLTWSEYHHYKQLDTLTTKGRTRGGGGEWNLKWPCEMESTIFKAIRSEKHNRERMDNGDERIGNDMAMCRKTNVIYKI